MEISNYKDLKDKGKIEIVKLGNSFAMVKKQYHPDTGESVSPKIEAFGKENVLELKGNLLKQLEQIDDILADIEEIEKKA